LQPGGLGSDPRRLPPRGLGGRGGGAIDLLGAPPRDGGRGLLFASGSKRLARVARSAAGGFLVGGRGGRGLGGATRLGIETLDVRPKMEAAPVRAQHRRDLAGNNGAIAGDRAPARRQLGLELEAGGGVGNPHDPLEESRHRTGVVAAHRVGQMPAAARASRIDDGVATGGRRQASRTGDRFRDDGHAALRGQGADLRTRQDVRSGQPGKGGVDRRLKRRIDDQAVADRPAPAGSRRTAEPGALGGVERPPGVVVPGTGCCRRGPSSCRAVRRQPRCGFRLGRGLLRGLPVGDRRRLRCEPRLEPARRRRALLRRRRGGCRGGCRPRDLVRGLALGLCGATASGVNLLHPRRLEAPHGRGVHRRQTIRRRRGLETAVVARLGDARIQAGELRLQLSGRCRHRQPDGVAAAPEIRLRGGAGLLQACPLSRDRLRVRRVPALAQLERRPLRAHPVHLGPCLGLRGSLAGKGIAGRVDCPLVLQELGHRAVDQRSGRRIRARG
jgi:hypothetical protein